MNLGQLFPDADYGFQFRFERGQVETFFGATAERERLLQERQFWLGSAPATYAACLPEGEQLLEEAIQLAQDVDPHFNVAPLVAASANPQDRCVALGQRWEPDYLLLKAGQDGHIRLWAACVCFPSSWSLEEKMGEPIEWIHSPVPGLNAELGPQIHMFLSKLRSGAAWLRSNWGLSRSPELNQHPARRLPRLDAGVELNEVWLRVEHQALVALPRTTGILFGIRISCVPLASLLQERNLRQRFARALRTMPEPVVRYKGLAAARPRLLQLIASC